VHEQKQTCHYLIYVNISYLCTIFNTFFSEGIPKLDVPVLDPYFTEEERTVYETSEIRADITVTNVNTYGLAKAQFLAVRPQYSDNYFKLEFDVDLPKVLIEGNYKADGAVGAFQIGGEGMQINYF